MQPRAMFDAVSVIALVVALAAISDVRFVLFGERAHQPLVDPNNYAALMYLVWIPLVHRHLSRAAGATIRRHAFGMDLSLHRASCWCWRSLRHGRGRRC